MPGISRSTRPARKAPSVPVIMVQDWAMDPPLAKLYVNGDTELELAKVYVLASNLLKHPGRGKIDYSRYTAGPTGRPTFFLHECTYQFMDQVFQCCASLLDYFADFVYHDTPAMKTAWDIVVDRLHEAVKDLPHAHWTNRVLYCEHAEGFAHQYESALRLMDRVLQARPRTISTPLIHHPITLNEPQLFQVGQWKAGLKGWQQYLLNGSPGFGVETKGMLSSGNGDQKVQVENKVCERHVPMGALAIVDSFTEHARGLALEHAQAETDLNENEFMNEFDTHSIKVDKINTYTSLTGHRTVAQPMHPSAVSRNAPRHHNGDYDPHQILSEPPLWMQDEAVGSFRGLDRFQHPAGNDKFHMFTVTSSADKDRDNKAGCVIAEKELEVMFDDWKIRT